MGDQSESKGSEPLAGVPNMFGDFFNNLGGGVFAFGSSFNSARADLPLAAGCRGAKIAEDDNALPQDRVFFNYNHFQDALQAESSLGTAAPSSRSFSVDRYTLGLEKTFFDGCWSVECRMPLAGRNEFAPSDFDVSGGDVGNLAIILKRVVRCSDTFAASIGLGVDLPTGSDVTGFAAATYGGALKTTTFVVHNDAAHLLPYVGFVSTPSERFFWEGFAQLDIDANPNRIDYSNNAGLGRGDLSEQNLLYLDLAAGYWLYRNPCACHLTGVAGMLELHYTTTLQDTDVVSTVASPPLTFADFANRVDVLNLTVGIHAELAKCTVFRIGAVVPLRSGDDRSFNSELQVQLERRF